MTSCFVFFGKLGRQIKQMFLRRREFIVEDSLLDRLFEQDKHIKSLYSIAFAIYLIFIINLGAQNFLLQNRIFDLDLIAWSFSKTEYAVIGWIFNFSCCCLLYLLKRPLLYASTSPVGQSLWLTFAWLYMISIFLTSALFTLYHKLPIATAMIVMAESIRLAMKSYAFIYGIVMQDDYLVNVKKDEDPIVTNYHYTGFNHFLYFLFCPSLVYRKEFPLRENIRWTKVIKFLADALCCVFFLSMVWINTSYNELHRKRYSTAFFIHYFNLIIPGTLIAFLVFYGFLHSWLNFMGELMRFGDRRFYTEWWTASTYSEYYRRWVFIKFILM